MLGWWPDLGRAGAYLQYPLRVTDPEVAVLDILLADLRSGLVSIERKKDEKKSSKQLTAI